MKLKKGYIMKELAGRYVVLPVGGEPEGFQGMIQMNVTGGFLWECLSEERTKQELIDLFLEKILVKRGYWKSDHYEEKNR